MQSAKSVGRTIGLVSLVRMPLAPVANFALLAPVTAATWLTGAAAQSTRVRAGLLVALTFAGLGLAIAVVAAPFLRRYSERMTLALVLLSVLPCVTALLEGATIVGMLSLSQQHATAGAASELLPAVGRAARATWRWAHFANLLAGQLASLAFAAILWRLALVPRALVGVVIAAITVSIVGLVPPLLGRSFNSLTMAPMVVQLALLAWLVVRGFAEPGAESEAAGRTRRLSPLPS